MKYYNKVAPVKAPPKFDITNRPTLEVYIVNYVDLKALSVGRKRWPR
jgi:hypothetical protein